MGAEPGDLPTFTVYSRPGCHLCEHLLEALMPLLRGRGAVEIRNIDTNEEWRHRFATRIPVVACRDRIVCEGRLDPAAIEAALGVCAAETDEPRDEPGPSIIRGADA